MRAAFRVGIVALAVGLCACDLNPQPEPPESTQLTTGGSTGGPGATSGSGTTASSTASTGATGVTTGATTGGGTGTGGTSGTGGSGGAGAPRPDAATDIIGDAASDSRVGAEDAALTPDASGSADASRDASSLEAGR